MCPTYFFWINYSDMLYFIPPCGNNNLFERKWLRFFGLIDSKYEVSLIYQIVLGKDELFKGGNYLCGRTFIGPSVNLKK